MILDRILEHKRAEVRHKQSRGYLADLKARIADRTSRLDFAITLVATRTPTSPALIDGTLYMQVLQRNSRAGRGRGGESYIQALDPNTGVQRWRHLRKSNARAESLEAFSTPIPFEAKGRKELVILGGEKIYEAFLPRAERLYLTFVDAELPGDTYFPEVDFSEWVEVDRLDHPADERHCYPFHIVELERREVA